jgi:hypothetical protein
VCLDEARFESTAVFHLRYAAVTLKDAVLAEPVTIAAHPVPFVYGGHPLREVGLVGDPRASVTDLTGVDAANLIVADVDLSQCRFIGSYNLDKIRFCP